MSLPCVYCDAKTDLLVNGVPLCVDCDKARDAGSSQSRSAAHPGSQSSAPENS
jgi:hypothetical protein